MTFDELRRRLGERSGVQEALREFSDDLSSALINLQAGVVPGAEDPVLSLLLGPSLSDLVRKVRWNSLVINPGSTSTKVSVYSGLKLLAAEEIRQVPSGSDGVDVRVNQIVSWFDRQKLRLSEITGIGARGGFLAPIPGGTYRVTQKMVEDLALAAYPHASNLSVPMAIRLGERVGQDVIITVTDPVTVDELDLVYRITGSARIRNDGVAVHYLNHRAAAQLLGQQLGKSVEDLHLITCHMGGGMSAARHLKGQVVQVAQAFGTMPSANRSGSLPLHHVIRHLEQHDLSLDDLKQDVMSQGGLLALAGTSDFRELFKFALEGASAEQHRKISLIQEFFANRVAGCILELSAHDRQVDLILLSGGLANDAAFCRMVADRIHLPVAVSRLPGSVEQQALAAGLLRACANPESRRNYVESREALVVKRKQEEALLDLSIFDQGEVGHGPSFPLRLEDILASVRSHEQPLTVAVVGADNEEALLAAKLANESAGGRMARFLLVGPYGNISQLAWELDVPIDDDWYLIVDTSDPVGRAMELLGAGLADTVMKGSVMTAGLLKGYLGYLKAKGLTGRGLRLSHLGLFEIPGRHKLVGITDAAINTYPDVEARTEILENAVEALHLLGFERPKVAVVSAVEQASKAVISSMDGQAIAERFSARQDMIIEGPLSVDLALSPFSAKEKHYHGQIQGDADLLLVPDIDAGNAIYKAFTVTSGANIAGAVIGGEAPFILTSRGDTSRSKLASIALVLALTQSKKSRRTP